MQIVTDPGGLAAFQGGALVPTMGALHEGHLALMRWAAPMAQPLTVSIFVNPRQFGPQDDFDRYPRDLDADAAAAAAAGAAVVFAPDVEAVYPPGYDAAVGALPAVATRPALEDACRPGHFAGVCEVLARLFDMVKPSVAVFGEKDYQQLLVVKELVHLHEARWPGLRVVGHPTVREPDGLAMSSRNRYLQPEQRRRALCLVAALRKAADIMRHGGEPAEAERSMRYVLAGSRATIDYAVVRDARTLEPLTSPQRPARALVAARLDDVRLIDNEQIGTEARRHEGTK